MLTKGYIIEKIKNNNKYLVRIPYFEKAGIQEKSYFEASLSHNPSSMHNYNTNDCVYIGFEEDDISKPVIIGKLYIDTAEGTSRGSEFINTLKVTDKAILPANSQFGDINVNDLLLMLKHKNNLEDRLSTIEASLKDLENLLKNI